MGCGASAAAAPGDNDRSRDGDGLRPSEVQKWRDADDECRRLSRSPATPRTPRARPPGEAGAKAVAFDAEPDVVAVPSIGDFAPRLRADCYWQEADFKAMLQQRRLLSVKVVLASRDHEGEDPPPIPGESRRGLGLVCEKKPLGTLAERQSRIKHRGRTLVDYQRSKDFSHENLAELAARLSERSRSAAAEIALRDREQVEAADGRDDGGSCPCSPEPSRPATPEPPPPAGPSPPGPARHPLHALKSPAHARRRPPTPRARGDLARPPFPARPGAPLALNNGSVLNDSLSGGALNDSLRGGSLNDSLNGGGLDVSRLIRVDSLLNVADEVSPS